MSISALDGFMSRKDADSAFVKLGDGESVRIKSLRNLEVVETTGFNGESKLTLRLTVVIDTSYGEKVKSFDNSSRKFAEELKKKNVNIGSSFTLTRHGETQKTVYFISDVQSVPQPVAQPQPQPQKQVLTPVDSSNGEFRVEDVKL